MIGDPRASAPQATGPLPLSPETTYVLLERVKQGDAAALNQLLERVLPRLQRWARGRVPAPARGMLDTADIVQDVVTNALKHVPTFESRGPGAFLSYLRQGVINRVLDERRRWAHRPLQAEFPPDMADEATSPLARAIGAENLALYEAALHKLDENDQAAIIGRFEWEYSYAELATVLGKPSPDAARVAVQRALKRLGEQVQHA